MGSESVLDASAVIALLYGEKGEQQVRSLLGHVSISAVNVSEVVAKLVRDGDTVEQARKAIGVLDLDIMPFDAECACEAGSLIRATRAHGLSFGDRACIALARRLKLPAVTAERQWSKLRGLDVEVRLIR